MAENYCNLNTIATGCQYSEYGGNYDVSHMKCLNVYGIHYVQKCTDIYYFDGTVKIKLKENCLYLFPANIEFNIRFDKKSENNIYNHNWLSFFARPGLCQHAIEYNVDDIPALKALIPLLKEMGKGDFLHEKRDFYFALNSFVSIVLTVMNCHTPFNSDENDQLEKVIFYIYKNLDSDLSIEKLSEIAMLNRAYFYKIFNNVSSTNKSNLNIGTSVV